MQPPILRISFEYMSAYCMLVNLSLQPLLVPDGQFSKSIYNTVRLQIKTILNLELLFLQNMRVG